MGKSLVRAVSPARGLENQPTSSALGRGKFRSRSPFLAEAGPGRISALPSLPIYRLGHSALVGRVDSGAFTIREPRQG